jgi:hypothetical protein
MERFNDLGNAWEKDCEERVALVAKTIEELYAEDPQRDSPRPYLQSQVRLRLRCEDQFLYETVS